MTPSPLPRPRASKKPSAIHTNPLERVNKEIKRRTKVVGIFLGETSAIRLVGAILSDLHDEWTVSDRRYLAEHTMTPLTETCDTHPAAPDQLGTG